MYFQPDDSVGRLQQLHWSTKKNFFIGASNIRAVLEYIWGADSENDGGFFASALVFEIRYTAHICLLVNLCRAFTSVD